MRRGAVASIVLGATIAALCTIMALVAWRGSVTDSGTDDGQAAPPFVLEDIDGDPIDSEALRGRPIVLHLGVIYCGGVIPDRGQDQLRAMSQANERDGDRAEFITVTWENCATTDLATIRTQYNITWRFANDYGSNAVYGPYADYFSQHGDPTIIIINPDGKISHHAGLMSADEIVVAIDDAEDGSVSTTGVERGISVAGMFGVGALTSLAPCSIALLVSLMAFLMARKGGAGRNGKKAPAKGTRAALSDGLAIGLAFTLGTVLVFLIIGFGVGYLGTFITMSPYFFMLAGAVLIVLGLNSAFSLFERMGDWFRSRRRSGRSDEKSTGDASPAWARTVQALWGRSPEVGAFSLGVLFSLAWAPCAIALVLPIIVLMLASKVGILAGGAFLFFFGLGHAVPIIPIAMATEASKARIANRYLRTGRWLTLAFGIIIVVMGALFLLRGFGVYLW